MLDRFLSPAENALYMTYLGIKYFVHLNAHGSMTLNGDNKTYTHPSALTLDVKQSVSSCKSDSGWDTLRCVSDNMTQRECKSTAAGLIGHPKKQSARNK